MYRRPQNPGKRVDTVSVDINHPKPLDEYNLEAAMDQYYADKHRPRILTNPKRETREDQVLSDLQRWSRREGFGGVADSYIGVESRVGKLFDELYGGTRQAELWQGLNEKERETWSKYVAHGLQFAENKEHGEQIIYQIYQSLATQRLPEVMKLVCTDEDTYLEALKEYPELLFDVVRRDVKQRAVGNIAKLVQFLDRNREITDEEYDIETRVEIQRKFGFTLGYAPLSQEDMRELIEEDPNSHYTLSVAAASNKMPMLYVAVKDTEIGEAIVELYGNSMKLGEWKTPKEQATIMTARNKTLMEHMSRQEGTQEEVIEWGLALEDKLGVPYDAVKIFEAKDFAPHFLSGSKKSLVERINTYKEEIPNILSSISETIMSKYKSAESALADGWRSICYDAKEQSILRQIELGKISDEEGWDRIAEHRVELRTKRMQNAIDTIKNARLPTMEEVLDVFDELDHYRDRMIDSIYDTASSIGGTIYGHAQALGEKAYNGAITLVEKAISLWADPEPEPKPIIDREITKAFKARSRLMDRQSNQRFKQNRKNVPKKVRRRAR